MKYYLFQGTPDKMEERLFRALVMNEPTVVELTKEEYETRMGIRRTGQPKEAPASIGQGMGKDSAKPVEPKVRDQGEAPKTRQEYIKALQGRGFEYKTLRSKKLGELKEMY